MRDLTHFMNIVNSGDAYASDLAIDKHFAGSAFPDTAFKAAFTVPEAMAMHRVTGLVQSGGNGETFIAGYFIAFEKEGDSFGMGNYKNWMFFYIMHKERRLEVGAKSK